MLMLNVKTYLFIMGQHWRFDSKLDKSTNWSFHLRHICQKATKKSKGYPNNCLQLPEITSPPIPHPPTNLPKLYKD